MAASIQVIAQTGERFASFGPYVAAVNDAGTVAFQATLVGGGTGVFTSAGGSICGEVDVCSHPALDNAGRLSFYAEHASRGQGVFVADPILRPALPAGGDAFAGIGPLGPTMNDAGTVALRATLLSGAHGIYTISVSGELSSIADTRPSDDMIVGFEGLPVVTNRNAVVFRATMVDSSERIYVSDAGALTVVAETGAEFESLGRFPMGNDGGVVAFAATLASGGSALCTAHAGTLTTVARSGADFESFRGALVDNMGTLVFFATPCGGQLAIYRQVDPAGGRVFGIGDALLGSEVAGFALNPVSINDNSQLAVRVELASGAEAVILICL